MEKIRYFLVIVPSVVATTVSVVVVVAAASFWVLAAASAIMADDSPGRVGMVYACVMAAFSASVEGMAGGMYSSYIPLPMTLTVLEGAPDDTQKE